MTGASTVKWTTLDLRTGVYESGSQQYTIVDFCEEKEDREHFQSILNYKAKQFMLAQKISQKNSA